MFKKALRVKVSSISNSASAASGFKIQRIYVRSPGGENSRKAVYNQRDLEGCLSHENPCSCSPPIPLRLKEKNIHLRSENYRHEVNPATCVDADETGFKKKTDLSHSLV